MVPDATTSVTEAFQSTEGMKSIRLPARGKALLDGAIYFCLILFAALLPHSIKGARRAWMAAGLLWIAKLAIERKRPFPQPLAAPLLAYLLLSGISTALSSDPYLSWPRMKIVCLVAAGIVVAQSIARLSQVRMLVLVLLLSGLAATIFTSWQYTYGIGVEVKYIVPGADLYHAGIRPGDVITQINGRSVRTAEQLAKAVEQSPHGSVLQIKYQNWEPYQKRETFLTREQFLKSELGTPDLQFVRGRPGRAQGTLGHYVVFAEMLMQVGCLTWAMLLTTRPRQWNAKAFYAIAFLAFAAALMATQTRADIAGLVAGCCLITLLLFGRRHARFWELVGLAMLLVAATWWIYHTRRMGWISPSDDGTRFRVLMWKDGLRLIQTHPWFGVGMDTILNLWQEWNIRAYSQYGVMYHFHSDYMQIAVERGLLTLAAWLWFVVAYLVFLVRLLRGTRQHSRVATGVVAGVLAGFVGYLFPSTVQYCLGDDTLVMLLFFGFGLTVAIHRMLNDPKAIDVP